MADKKISQLTNITGANVVDSTDELAIVDASSNETKAITREELFKSVGGATFNGDISIGDIYQIRLGASNDLTIEHNATNGVITNNTNHFYLANKANDKDVYIQSDDGSGGITNYFVADGSTGRAKLYYYGSETLITRGDGIGVTGHVLLADNGRLRLGDSNDLDIYHDGVNSYIAETGTGALIFRSNTYSFRNSANTEQVMLASEDGAVTLYYDNSAKLATSSAGVDITGDLTVDTSTLYVDSTNNFVGIGQTSPGAELHIKGANPQFRLQPTGDTQSNRIEFCNAAGSIQSRILGGGVNGDLIQLDGNVQVQGGHNLNLPDNVELRFGTGEDLKIDHNGTNSFIANDTGDLYINQNADDKDVIIQSDNGSGGTANYFRADGSTGQAKMYHLGSLKLTTQSWGVGLTGDLNVSGALSKGSGSFKIDHPLKPETHHLVHSFVEAPQADNIYRGKVALVDGSATVNLDEAGRMTEGTFVALNGNIQCFTTNEDGWTAVRGSVSGNTLTIEAQDASCTDTVSWLVIGERHDQHMLDTGWTDGAGRVITEPEKQLEEEE